MRKTIKVYGSHGRSVRVFVESFTDRARETLCRVQWREAGRLRTESLPDSRENRQKAHAFAAGVAERLSLRAPEQRERLTMLQLGERYTLAHPVPETWREKTAKTFAARWKVWMTFATPDRLIDSITPDTLDDFRKALRDDEYAVNQIANHVQMVKSVYRFARSRKYLVENPIDGYTMKLSRDQRRLEVPEWTVEECGKILAQLSPRHGRQWRAHVAIVLDAVLGGRSNALLQLEWRDVDLTARTVRWRPELDKLGKDRVQPLPRDAVRAFRIAKVWRARIGYSGPFVLPAARKSPATRRAKASPGDHHYRYSSLNGSLHEAANRAGVRWITYRAMHGFRRMVVNNVLTMTGNLVRAGQYIGDTDARTLSRSYVRARPEELRDVAGALTLERSPQRNRNGKSATRSEEPVKP